MKDFISWLQAIGHGLKDWFNFMTVKEWIALAIIIAALAVAMTGTSATRKVVRRRRRRKPKAHQPQSHESNDNEQIHDEQQIAQVDDDSTQSVGANEEFAVEQGRLATEDVTRNESSVVESMESNQGEFSVEQGEVAADDVAHDESLSPTIEHDEAEEVLDSLESEDNVEITSAPEQAEEDASELESMPVEDEMVNDSSAARQGLETASSALSTQQEQPVQEASSQDEEQLPEEPIEEKQSQQATKAKQKPANKIKRRRPISIKVHYDEPNVGKTRQRDDIASVTGGGDTVAAQLNLARVYADIGDTKEAKQLLREVLKSGSEEQKQTAQEFMKKLEE